jgi:serine/threonine-protein kinase
MTRLASTGEKMTRFFTELRRRRVFRVGAAYALVGWFLIQAADVIVEPMNLPEWIQPLLIMSVFLGFPVALLLAWAFDLTPGGVERTPMLGTDADPDSSSLPSSGRPPPEAERSVAVLPFANLSQAPENEYFSDGITDDLITHLSKIRDLRVISRTSVMRFKGRTVSLQEIGRELGVSRVLEGSVRRGGDRVRVNAQLIDVATDDHLWAEMYDRDLEDIFAIQLEVASRIAESLQAHLSVEEETGLARQPTGDMEAYDLYLKGRYHWNLRTETDLGRSVELLQRAVDRDPDYSLALAGLADSYIMLGVYGAHPPDQTMPQARRAAERALDLDDVSAPALVSRGSVRGFYDWDWQGAEEDYRRAIDLNPGYALAHQWYATNLLLPLSRFDEGRDRLEEAKALDPLSPAIRVSFGVLAFFERDFDRARQELSYVLEDDPRFGIAHFMLGGCHQELGDASAATTAFREAVDLSGRSVETVAGLGHCLARAGQVDEARILLAELNDRAQEAYVSPTRLAQLRLGLGENDAALDLLEEAASVRAADLVWLRVSPTWDPLRESPRFQALATTVLGSGTGPAGEDG